MKYERFTWKTEKLQHSDDEVIMVVDNANKDWKGHILNVIDMLNELNDERMMYKTTIDKRIIELEEENKVLLENLFERQEYFRKSDKEYHERIMKYQTEIKGLKNTIFNLKNEIYNLKDDKNYYTDEKRFDLYD